MNFTDHPMIKVDNISSSNKFDNTSVHVYNNNCNSGLYTITIASKNPDKWKNIISFRENENILGYRIGLRGHQRIKSPSSAK